MSDFLRSLTDTAGGALLVGFLLVLQGCSSQDVKPAATRGERPRVSPAAATDQATSRPAITADLKSVSEVEALIASHRGKVVVADLWALW
jgi:hypothetical protein